MVLIEPAEKHIGRSGEFLDPWGTPYQIEFTGQTNYCIRSASINLKFGDKDDIVYDSSRQDFIKQR